jgi:hypothetical protein
MSNWENIQEANSLINTIQLKGKEYAEVKERVIAFRRVHPLGQIITEPSFTDNFVIFEAVAFDGDGKMLAKGHAREYLKTEFALEKAESSSIGRCLGFCGYGISTSIASAEDIENMDKPSEIFDEPPMNELVSKFNALFTNQEKADFLNCVHKVDVAKVGSKLLIALIEYKENEKHNPNK